MSGKEEFQAGRLQVRNTHKQLKYALRSLNRAVEVDGYPGLVENIHSDIESLEETLTSVKSLLRSLDKQHRRMLQRERIAARSVQGGAA